MPKVNYIREHSAFTEYAMQNSLSSNERALWTVLFCMTNKMAKGDQWPDQMIAIHFKRLMGCIACAEDTLRRARQGLCDKGLIQYKPGLKNEATAMYKLNYFTADAQEPEDKQNNITANGHKFKYASADMALVDSFTDMEPEDEDEADWIDCLDAPDLFPDSHDADDAGEGSSFTPIGYTNSTPLNQGINQRMNQGMDQRMNQRMDQGINRHNIIYKQNINVNPNVNLNQVKNVDDDDDARARVCQPIQFESLAYPGRESANSEAECSTNGIKGTIAVNMPEAVLAGNSMCKIEGDENTACIAEHVPKATLIDDAGYQSKPKCNTNCIAVNMPQPMLTGNAMCKIEGEDTVDIIAVNKPQAAQLGSVNHCIAHTGLKAAAAAGDQPIFRFSPSCNNGESPLMMPMAAAFSACAHSLQTDRQDKPIMQASPKALARKAARDVLGQAHQPSARNGFKPDAFNTDDEADRERVKQVKVSFLAHFGRSATPTEAHHIAHIAMLDKLPMPMVDEAIQAAALHGPASPAAYIRTLLNQWHDMGITQPQQLNEYRQLQNCLRNPQSDMADKTQALIALCRQRAEGGL